MLNRMGIFPPMWYLYFEQFLARGGMTLAQKRSKAAHESTYQTKKNPVRPLIWVTVAVIALFLIIGIINQAQQKRGDIVSYDEPPPLDGQPVLGEPDAPVVVIEFGDYKCPSCQYWNERILPQLKADYIDSGKVRYVYINTLFHGEESALAALAGETVLEQHPEHFWDFHHALFAAQEDQNKQWVTVEKLTELAEAHVPGIDTEQFVQALTDKAAQPAVDADEDLVDRYNVQLTPSIMVNHLLLPDPFDYDALRETIEEQLAANPS